MTRTLTLTLGGAAAAWLSMAGAAAAQTPGNPAYQTFFTAACAGATGQLAALCAVSRGGSLSTDSESSLTPSQAAVTGSTALARAQALAATTEKRLETLRDEADSGEPAPEGGFSLFGSVQGEWSDQDREVFANERGFDADAVRVTVGADYRMSAAATFGASLTYGDYNSDFDANRAGNAFTPQEDAGGIDATDWTVTVFAGFIPAPDIWFDAQAGIGFVDYDLRRNAIFQESNRVTPQTNSTAVASPDGRQYFAAVGVGYDAAMGSLSLGPYARLRYARSKVDGYTEQDPAGLALNVSASRTTSVTSVLGLRASNAVSTSWGVVVPQARIEWEHEFDDDPRTTLTSLVQGAPGAAFQVTNDPPDRNYFNAGAGLLFVLPNGWMPFVDYEGLIGYRDQSRHRVTAGLRVEF